MRDEINFIHLWKTQTIESSFYPQGDYPQGITYCLTCETFESGRSATNNDAVVTGIPAGCCV